MKIHVLGSAAGGGFPQWNCNCPQCSAVRTGSAHHVARTQSSIAVTANETDWLLINASPDVLQQIKAFDALQPARALRDTGIAAVLLMDAQIDQEKLSFFAHQIRVISVNAQGLSRVWRKPLICGGAAAPNCRD